MSFYENCCSSRVWGDGREQRRSLDTTGSITSILMNRMSRLEEQVTELRQHAQQQKFCIDNLQSQCSSACSKESNLGKPQPAFPDLQAELQARQSATGPSLAHTPITQSATGPTLAHTPITEDTDERINTLKHVQDAVEDAVRTWNGHMGETKYRLEQAVSILSTRVVQALSSINDLKTVATKRCDTLETRIARMEDCKSIAEEPLQTQAKTAPSSEPMRAETLPSQSSANDPDKIGVATPPDRIETATSQVNVECDIQMTTAGNSMASITAGNSMASMTPTHKESLSTETSQQRGRLTKVAPKFIFAESIWDAYLFVGEPEVGVLGSVIVFLLFWTNVFLQVSFCLICFGVFNKNAYDDATINGLTDFRTVTSHDYRYQDPFTGTSLARRLCHNDNENYLNSREIYATTQIDLLATVDEYIGDGAGLFQFRGELMCLLSLLCWVFNVAREAKNVWHYHAALHGLEVRRHSELSKVDSSHDSKIIIECLSYLQYFIFVKIILFRIGICIVMLFTGCKWLGLTPEIEDLLLNAVALEFVLSVDELVFAAAVPRQTKVFISKIAPVAEKRWVFYKGVDVLSVSVITLTPTISILFYNFYVVYLVDQMIRVNDALCNQDLDFVFGMDTIGFVWFQNSASYNLADSPLQAAQRSSISNRIAGASLEMGMVLPFRWISTVKTMVNLNWDELVSTNSGCSDALSDGFSSFKTTHLAWFRHKLDDASISTCSDLQSMGLCSAFGSVGPQARWLCSETCECNNPLSISPSHLANGGCPETCELSSVYASHLAQISCIDMTPGALQASTFWKLWAAFLKDGMDDIHLQGLGTTLYKNMTTLGCGFLDTAPEKAKLCSGSTATGLRPLAPICPITCRCVHTWLQQCPTSCFSLYLNTSSWIDTNN